MKEKISIAIGIPTINRYDLLKPFLKKYNILFPLTDVFVVDNGNQGIKEDREISGGIENIYIPEKPLCVAASWNHLCRSIFQLHTHALILNDDVLLDKTETELLQFLNIHQDADFIQSKKGYCSFIIPKKTFKEIGPFDEMFFGAYYEDNDYAYRLKLAKKKVVEAAFLNPSVHNVSGSSTKDPKLNDNFMRNAYYFSAKWGGLPKEETYLKPFNNK